MLDTALFMEDEWNDDLTAYMYMVVNDNSEKVIFQTQDEQKAFDIAEQLEIYGLVTYTVYKKPLMYYTLDEGGFEDDDE